MLLGKEDVQGFLMAWTEIQKLADAAESVCANS